MKHSDLHPEAISQVGSVDKPISDDLTLELGYEEAPLRLRLQLFAQELHRARRLVRQRDAAHVNPGFEIRVALGSADLQSHPDLFSFPCFFAYRAPRRKTSRPSGIETAPITSSGQMSRQTAAGPAPFTSASLIPR